MNVHPQNAVLSWPAGPVKRDELVVWGRQLGASISWPAIITLEGDLGAGKTTLTQAICEGLGVVDDVTSPTFALVHEYRGANGPVYHLDLYRLRDERDLQNIGFDEIISGAGIVVIEWPDRAGSQLPKEALRIVLQHVTAYPDLRLVAPAT